MYVFWSSGTIMGHLYYKQHLEEKRSEKKAATRQKSKIETRNQMKQQGKEREKNGVKR